MRFQITKQPSEPVIIEIPSAAISALTIKSSTINAVYLMTIFTQAIKVQAMVC